MLIRKSYANKLFPAKLTRDKKLFFLLFMTLRHLFSVYFSWCVYLSTEIARNIKIKTSLRSTSWNATEQLEVLRITIHTLSNVFTIFNDDDGNIRADFYALPSTFSRAASFVTSLGFFTAALFINKHFFIS